MGPDGLPKYTFLVGMRRILDIHACWGLLRILYTCNSMRKTLAVSLKNRAANLKKTHHKNENYGYCSLHTIESPSHPQPSSEYSTH